MNLPVTITKFLDNDRTWFSGCAFLPKPTPIANKYGDKFSKLSSIKANARSMAKRHGFRFVELTLQTCPVEKMVIPA